MFNELTSRMYHTMYPPHTLVDIENPQQSVQGAGSNVLPLFLNFEQHSSLSATVSSFCESHESISSPPNYENASNGAQTHNGAQTYNGVQTHNRAQTHNGAQTHNQGKISVAVPTVNDAYAEHKGTSSHIMGHTSGVGNHAGSYVGGNQRIHRSHYNGEYEKGNTGTNNAECLQPQAETEQSRPSYNTYHNKNYHQYGTGIKHKNWTHKRQNRNNDSPKSSQSTSSEHSNVATTPTSVHSVYDSDDSAGTQSSCASANYKPVVESTTNIREQPNRTRKDATPLQEQGNPRVPSKQHNNKGTNNDKKYGPNYSPNQYQRNEQNGFGSYHNKKRYQKNSNASHNSNNNNLQHNNNNNSSANGRTYRRVNHTGQHNQSWFQTIHYHNQSETGVGGSRVFPWPSSYQQDMAYYNNSRDSPYPTMPYMAPADKFFYRAHLMEVKEEPQDLFLGSKYDQLTRTVWEKFMSIQQTESTFRNKMLLWKYLFLFMRSFYGRYGLFLVGSTMTGLGCDKSDVDLCVLIRQAEMDQRIEAVAHLANIQNCLTNCGVLQDDNYYKFSEFFKDFTLISAKVPILKFKEITKDLDVDINCNNYVGIRNTHLLYCYSQMDWRVRPLVVIIKHWARHNLINNAKNSTISSYSLTLMVIHFLQCGVTVPVLPCLHVLYPEKFRQFSDVHTIEIQEKLIPHVSENKQSLGELLIEFLKYYSYFNFLNDAISVRLGRRVSINECRYSSSYKNDPTQWMLLCIEEPFDLTNTARSVHNIKIFSYVKEVIQRSYMALHSTLDLKSIFTLKISVPDFEKILCIPPSLPVNKKQVDAKTEICGKLSNENTYEKENIANAKDSK